MSTSQKVVMLCGWGVKADMVCLQVELCVAVSKHFENATVFKGALQMSRFTLLCFSSWQCRFECIHTYFWVGLYLHVI